MVNQLKIEIMQRMEQILNNEQMEVLDKVLQSVFFRKRSNKFRNSRMQCKPF